VTSLRPLDPLRSIKVKLGVLVFASVSVSALVLWYGLLQLGWQLGYTLPVAVLLALAVTQLLANVSHELRTPITALQAVLENLVDGVARPDPATLQAALTQTERLGRLVHELLDLSRIDAGTEPLTRREVPLRPALEAAVAEAKMRGATVSFVVDVNPPDALAWADPERLQQVLANLLDNATRHSPPRGSVRVAAGVTAGDLQLVVCDDGPGIPPAERDRVFERFYRGDRDNAGDATGGTGLGLAIARWAVALHGGRISVTGNELDGNAASGSAATERALTPGCRFVVDLPGKS
jgi:signal transduction histidine kinase